MKANYYLLLILFCLTFNAFGTEVKFVSNKWPNNSSCNQCIVIKTSAINISFPSTKIKYIKMLNMDGVAFSIVTDSTCNGVNNELVILELSESNVTGGMSENGHYEKLGVNTLEGFFNKLHDQNSNSEDVEIARRIMGIKDASSFGSYQKDLLSAFWVANNDKDNQSLYILSQDNKPSSLQISGYLNNDIVERILSTIELNLSP